MNRLVLLCLIICISYANAAKNLCPNETFLFEDYRVNQFYQIDLNITLKPVGFYMIDIELDFNDYFEDKIASKLNDLKNIYQKVIMKVYSKSILDDKSERFKIRTWKTIISNIKKEFSEIKHELKDSRNSAYLDDMEISLNRGINFIDYLFIFGQYKLDKKVVSYDALSDLLVHLKINREKESLIFENKTLNAYYKYFLFQTEKFIFNRYSDIFYHPKSYGEILSSIYIPVQSNEYDPKSPCTPISNLPLFFTFKGGK